MAYETDILEGLVGGALIGVAAGWMLLSCGKIMGCSGMLTVFCEKPLKVASLEVKDLWKIVFLASSMCFCLLYRALCPTMFEPFSVVVPGFIPQAIAGLLVGFGTSVGNGCTSGHGICGLGRLSIRSFVNVCSFLGTGIVVATLIASTMHGAVYNDEDDDVTPTATSKLIGYTMTGVFALLFLSSWYQNLETLKTTQTSTFKMVIAPLVGAILFNAGLVISGMSQISRVLGFLNLNVDSLQEYDATLMFVMGGGCTISLASYQYKLRKGVEEPYLCPYTKAEGKSECGFELPKSKTPDKKLVYGGILFGIGWGIGGLCPGPAIVHLAIGTPVVLYAWFPAFVVGKGIYPIVMSKLGVGPTSPMQEERKVVVEPEA